jgi:hypothetical protein
MGRGCSRYVNLSLSLSLFPLTKTRFHTDDDFFTDRKQEEFHGLMHFPTDNLPSFLEVSEEPDPQNLSPAALQCYCKFKKPKIETTPASSFNNQGDEGENSFIQENSIENKKNTKNSDSEKDGRIGLLEENEHQSLRHSRRTQNKYEDSTFMDQLESYENMFTGDEKEVGLW